MALFGRKRALTASALRIQTVRSSRSSLVAAAARLNLQDRPEAARQMRLRQGWQLNAWAYRDSIGELRYALNFLANCAARMRIYPAAYPLGGESDSPVALSELEETVPAGVITACAAAMLALGNGKMALSHVMHALDTNMNVAGECWLVGQTDPQTGVDDWSIRSISELQIKDDRYYLRQLPTDSQGIFGAQELNPELTVISRIWRPHPQWRMLADSPMRAMQDDCESLLILRRMIRAAGRSRLAGAGLLGIPEELEIRSPQDDNADPEADDFLGSLSEAMMMPLDNEGAASAVVPILLRGPGEQLKNIVHIKLSDQFAAEDAATRSELIGVIATTLDLPKEVVTGVADLNHWSAWSVDDNTFRHHVEPDVIHDCDCLTGAFLRPFLEEEGVEQEWVDRLLFWYDPTELVTHPDQTADALQLHDRLVISDEALLKISGFADSDRPGKAEIQVRLLEKMRNWPPNLVMAFLHQWDPTIVAPAITVAGTIPGIKPSGVDTGAPPLEPGAPAGTEPVASGQAPPPAPTPSADQPAPGPPQITASAPPDPPNYRPQDNASEHCANCRMFNDGACWGYGNKPVKDDRVCDSWAPDALSASSEPNSGVMVALYPDPQLASQLALPGGKPAEELHITLAFLGDSNDLSDPDALRAAVESWAQGTSPIAGEISGVGLFTAGEDPVTYLSVDLPSLPAAREDLVTALSSAGLDHSQTHGFTPHLTLDYADRVHDVPDTVGGTEIRFERVSVVVGEDRTDYSLAGALVAAGRLAQSARLSRKLVEIDRDLRARLQTAANAAMLRHLERAGSKLRSKVARDETMRSKIAHRSNERAAAFLGEQAIAAAGLSATELLSGDWSGLRAQFTAWVTDAQKQALKLAAQIAPLSPETTAKATADMAGARDAGWQAMEASLSASSQHLLYNPDPNTAAGDWGELNPDTLVPTGTIRAALALAGGAGTAAITSDGSGAISVAGPVGQIGTGDIISGALSDAGGEQANFEWVHGPALNPFEPHEALDGVQFQSFDDDALANTGDFPENSYFMPGDHDGCSCDFSPLWDFPGNPANDSEGDQ